MTTNLSKPMNLRAAFDEAKSLTHMMDAVGGAQFDAPAAATQTVFRSLHAACVQAHIDPADDLSPEDIADIFSNALRNLILADETVDIAIYMVATEAYSMKLWLAKGMDSWDEYVDAALVEGEKADKWKPELSQLSQAAPQIGELIAAAGIGRNPDKMKHWLKRTVPNVLFPAKEHPVQLKDGTQVDHIWLAHHEPSITMELTPMASRLDMDNPEHVQVFQEALTVAATQPREALRNFKKQEGYQKSKLPQVHVPAELVEVVDAATGEVTYQWRVLMTFDTEADWSFFWMALAKRYNFVVTTRTEKHDHSKSRSSAGPAANGRGRGRGQSAVHPVSGRNRSRK